MIKKILVCLVIMLFLIPGLFAQKKYLNINTSEFKPKTHDQYYLASTQYLQNVAGPNSDYYAPIHLPQGAKIKNVVISYHDNSSSKISVSIYRQNFTNTSDSAYLFEWESNIQIGADQTFKIEGWTMNYKYINNVTYSYCIKVNFEGTSNLYLLGIRIAYE